MDMSLEARAALYKAERDTLKEDYAKLQKKYNESKKRALDIAESIRDIAMYVEKPDLVGFTLAYAYQDLYECFGEDFHK